MTKYSRAQTNGLEVALAIHLSIYCAAAACFALGFYVLMQPSRHANPGMSAYKPPSAMVMTYMPSFRNVRDPMPFTTVVAEKTKETAKPETAKRAQAAEAQKPAQEAMAEPTKRQRAATAPRERREPWARYAEQPGGYRPWF
jgi:hypothetical protein